jgi:hypothetical protein
MVDVFIQRFDWFSKKKEEKTVEVKKDAVEVKTEETK